MSDLSLIHELHGRTIKIIGAASGVGANDRRCEDGPDTLRARGLITRLQDRGIKASWNETLRPNPLLSQDKFRLIGELCKRLAHKVRTLASNGDIPVILGGDHSCAIGSWSGIYQALPKNEHLGLIWIDAHMDAHTPQTSMSGAVHGMPLAVLLGFGDASLSACGGSSAKLLPQHVCLIGVRSFEAEEAALLARLGVRVFAMDEITRRGLSSVMQDALAIVQNGTVGFGVSIDLDALDPEEAPAVGTPAPGGIRANDMIAAFGLLRSNPALLGLEIAEFNPHRDKQAQSAELVADLLVAALSSEPASPSSLIALEKQYGAHNYDTLPVVLTRGQGVYLWDDMGRRYLDMMSAYSAVSHGHAHPRLVRALNEQARTLAVTSRAFYTNRLPVFLQKLCQLAGQDQALPVNTGLEAVETALKAARKWAYRVKGVPHGEAEIIACEGNFHGRSIAILGMSSEAQYRDGFGPYPAGFNLIRYADAQALDRAITSHTAAFLVEPIQGEGGIIVPPPGYLAECARICRERNVLLICDEVQTGLGRTGKLFAYQHDGIQPDGLILGKALGGGMLPVAAFLARHEVMQVFTPGDHGSTFGGNPLAAAVGLEALNVLIEEHFVERAQELGADFLHQLSTITSPLIREVRGKGLFIGIEIYPDKISARALCEKLLEHGILTKDTHHRVVRFAPPLIISETQIDWAVAEIRRVFSELDAGLHPLRLKAVSAL